MAVQKRLLRVLLVDDGGSARALISDVLSDADVTVADDASQGLALLAQGGRPGFDLIVIVCRHEGRRRRLPSGVKLTRTIRTRWPWIPVTAVLPISGSEGLFLEAFGGGRGDFVDKALDIGQLAALRPPSRPRADPRLDRVITFIGEHYTERLSLDDLAHLARMTRLQFARLFRIVTGTSLRDHVRNLRLARARHLMETTSKTLTDIALEAGFYDLPHFDKTFRKQFGVSPTDFVRRVARVRARRSPLRTPERPTSGSR